MPYAGCTADAASPAPVRATWVLQCLAENALTGCVLAWDMGHGVGIGKTVYSILLLELNHSFTIYI